MSPHIRVLAAEVVNQIAAGEMGERPASMVRDPIENSLDAGARRVDVDMLEVGLRSTRIVDDGCGMSPEELRPSLLRHATSKPQGVEDLWPIRTMGFRGEALPKPPKKMRMVPKARSKLVNTSMRTRSVRSIRMSSGASATNRRSGKASVSREQEASA